MEELLLKQDKLKAELSDLIKREEIYIHLLPSLSKDESCDVENDLREIRLQRQDTVIKLNEVGNQIKKFTQCK